MVLARLDRADIQGKAIRQGKSVGQLGVAAEPVGRRGGARIRAVRPAAAMHAGNAERTWRQGMRQRHRLQPATGDAGGAGEVFDVIAGVCGRSQNERRPARNELEPPLENLKGAHLAPFAELERDDVMDDDNQRHRRSFNRRLEKAELRLIGDDAGVEQGVAGGEGRPLADQPPPQRPRSGCLFARTKGAPPPPTRPRSARVASSASAKNPSWCL